MRHASRVTLSPEELSRLRSWVDDVSARPRIRERARIVLWAAAGHSDAEIAKRLRKNVATVALWRRRFLLHRLTGELRDAPRPGRRPKHTAARADAILHATFNDRPARGIRWTTRTMARRFGVNHMAVQRVWQSQGVSPRRAYRIADRLAGPTLPFVDLLGVVVQPPTRIVAVGVELTGETRIPHVEPLSRALRTEISGAYLLHANRPDPEDLVGVLQGFETMSHAPAGRRHQLGNLLILLREIQERTSATTRVHLLAEGRGAAKDARLLAWLRQHPRFILHDLPVGAGWTAEVARFFGQWRSAPLRAGSLLGISSFTRAGARIAASPTDSADGVLWSVAHAVPSLPGGLPGEMSVTPWGPIGRAPALPLDPTDSPSVKPRTSEKFLLRTSGP